MSPALDYSDIVKRAEAAVASVADADLRMIAFGKIMDSLLEQTGGASGKKDQNTPDRATRPSHARVAAGGLKKGGPTGYVDELIGEGFFKTPKCLADVRTELGNRGHHVPLTSLSRPMMLLCRDRRLRRQKEKNGNKEIFTYSNW